MQDILDMKNTSFNDITFSKIDKYNDGDLFGLKLKSFSNVYPSISGKTGNLEGTVKVAHFGSFKEPMNMLFKKISYNLVQDMITGKYLFICNDMSESYNYLDLAGFDINMRGISKYYYTIEKALNNKLPYLAINLSEDVVDIVDDYRIKPENVFIDAVDVYKKELAETTLIKKDELFLLEDHLEKRTRDIIKEEYKNYVNIVHELAITDNVIYDTEKKNKKM